MEPTSALSIAIGAASKSIETLKTLRGIDLKMQTAEYKNALADLTTDLADLKMKLVEVQEENLKLQKIIDGKDQKAELRKAFKAENASSTINMLTEEKFGFRSGKYCPHCFESKGDMMVLTPHGIYYKCFKCNGQFH